MRTGEQRPQVARSVEPFSRSCDSIGDLSETIALVWPKTEVAVADAEASERSLTYYIDLVLGLKEVPDEEKRTRVVNAWTQLDETGRFVFNKIITGEFRIGVSQKLMVRALAQHTGAEENHLAHLLMGAWDPRSTSFAELMDVDNASTALSRPYPFYLAYALACRRKSSAGWRSGSWSASGTASVAS